jgi:hypothetical protein
MEMNIIEECVRFLEVFLNEDELLQLVDFHKIRTKTNFLGKKKKIVVATSSHQGNHELG